MKVLIVKLIIVFALIVLFSLSMFRFIEKTSSYEDAIKDIKISTNFLDKKIEHIKVEINKSLTEERLADDIVFSGAKEDFLIFFTFLDDDYALKDVHYEVSEPEAVKIRNYDGFFQIFRTNVMISLKCDSEAKLYMFLEEIKEKTPGYVAITKLSLAKGKAFIKTTVNLSIFTIKEC